MDTRTNHISNTDGLKRTINALFTDVVDDADKTLLLKAIRLMDEDFGEEKAEVSIAKLKQRFEELRGRNFSSFSTINIADISDEISPVLHQLWANDRRVEGKNVWFRPAKFINDDEKVEWLLQFKTTELIERCSKTILENGVNVFYIDILNLTFDQLSPAWKVANNNAAIRAATIICAQLSDGMAKINLEQMAEKVHEGWVLDPSNSWKLESVRTYGNISLIDEALAKIQGQSKFNQETLDEIYHAAATLRVPNDDGTEEAKQKIKAVTEVKLQFIQYSELTSSEKLRDIVQVMAAIESILKQVP